MRSVLTLSFASAVLGAALSAQQPAAQPGKLFKIDGSNTQVRLWSAQGTWKNAFSRDGGNTWTEFAAPDFYIGMQYGAFDPGINEPMVPPSLSAPAANRLFLVQFHTQPVEEYTEALRRLGVEVHTYLPQQAYLVRMDAALVARVRALEFVRWVGAYHPAYRMEPAMLADLLTGVPLATARYNILVVDSRRDDSSFERFVRRIGGEIATPGDGGGLISATLTHGQLVQTLVEDTVMYVDRWTPPSIDMNNARIQAGVDALHNLAMPIDGKGLIGHVNEGILVTHPEFAARAPYRTVPQSVIGSSSQQHGTATAGEIYSMGVQAQYRGSLPFGQMWHTGTGGAGGVGSGSYSTVYAELVNPNRNPVIKAVMSTQSWGGSQTTQYTSTSAAMDTAIFNNDIFVTQSQSNLGNAQSRPEAWAKNICSVGGFNHFNNSSAADDCWCNTGSTGPASDGRIGVTLTGYYDSIATTYTNAAATTATYTTSFGGTSGATPMNNGFCGLIITMFTDGLFGYPSAGWQSRWDVKPHFTTTKVLAMTCTREMPLTKATRVQQGWGFPNVEDLYIARDNVLVIDEEKATLVGPSRDILTQGGSRSYLVFVKPGTTQFRAAMTYADPAPSPISQAQHRLNDLSLDVTDPNNVSYVGNGGLLTSLWSTPSTTNNTKDTEEMVKLQNPASGAWVVTVKASQIVVDSHRETAAMDADYALAVRGIGGGRDTSGMVLDLISTANGDFRIAPSNVPAGGWTTGYTLLTVDSSRLQGSGNFFGLELDLLSLSLVAFPPVAGGVFAFTNSGNPLLYPTAPFAFPAPIASAVSGVTFDGVVYLVDALGKVVDVSNVDRVTVQ